MKPEIPEPAWLSPEVAYVGDLAAALQRVAVEIGVDVGDVTTNEHSPLSHARVASAVPEREALGVSVDQVNRCFSLGGWGQGIQLLTGSTDDLAEVVRLAHVWRTGVPLVEIRRRAPFVTVSERALAHERGPEHVVAYQWRQLFADVEEQADWPEFGELVRAAYGEPRLRQLYVYTSHWSIQFSTCTGFPFAHGGVPHLQAAHDRSPYRVVSPCDVLVGETTTPQEAVALAVRRLSDHTGPAVSGTAEAAPTDPWWEEAARRCGRDACGDVPRFLLREVTVAHWEAVFNWVGGGRRPWRYAEGGAEPPLPTAAAVFARPADAPPATLQMSLGAPASILTFYPTLANELCFDLDLSMLADGDGRLTTLLELVDEIWRKTQLTGPFLMAPQTDPARPILAVHALSGVRLRLLD
ncbi:hypothetical protein GA0074692_2657 [Micromonospora pallida]|uniref:Uncharacterized protein n=1 Tax=Micromonospora pallida TaxID=145854 RepID=A0A1C6SI52_9ACTN|nr:DUF6193 family natural product biosynthesis protein [Micromonospora pallida]SCL29068.1 hypothetical protein GA0074692_2657 [Micromonospora pallida]